MKRICVVGTGYVGLVTGTCLAELGNEVTCLDVVPEKIEALRQGKIPIYEPGLDLLVTRNAEHGRLRFTTSYDEAVPGADFIFIAVGTPSEQDGSGADMRYVHSAAQSIGEHLSGPAVIINKSTIPVGSGDVVSDIVRSHLRMPSVQFAVVSNPEFLREGNAVHDFMHPDRVVLGSADAAAAQKVAQLYLPLRAPIMITDIYTAEMIKYASNAFLATKISFINEVARICELLGADVNEVADGMGFDKRIAREFLNAGIGFGGSCFPKDVKALKHTAEVEGFHPQLLDAVLAINLDQRKLVIAKLKDLLGGEESLKERKVALLGLAFKANTDDMRDAPAIDIAQWLLDAGVSEIRAYDPVATETAQQVMPKQGITYCESALDAARGCDAIVIVTEWPEFRDLHLQTLRAATARADGQPVLVDGRNLFQPQVAVKAGFLYGAIGYGRSRAQGSNGAHMTVSPDQPLAAGSKGA